MVLTVCMGSCGDFLDPKPDQGLLVPTSLDDFQLLMDNNVVFNRQSLLPTISSDEFWTNSEAYQNMTVSEQGAYLWKEDPYQGDPQWDWEVAYQQVFYANVVLEGLADYTGPNIQRKEELEGMALFYRSYAYFQLLQEFAPAFRKSGGNEQLLGIVLRNGSDVNIPSKRASLAESYSQMIGDLEKAVELLPDSNPLKTRPTQAVGFALLAKSYLLVFEFEKALNVAEASLSIYTERQDFNELDVDALRPFTRFDAETMFYSVLHSSNYTRGSETFVDTLLIQAYDSTDLRLKTYFNPDENGLYRMSGHLTGSTILFGGIGVGEVQLIAAESAARTGNESLALQHLNDLLINRYEAEYWQPLDEIGGEELLKRILLERRKELIGRGVRWSDLRRLNQEEGFESEIRREVDGEIYLLESESSAYVFPIPDNEIQRSGIAQNER